MTNREIDALIAEKVMGIDVHTKEEKGWETVYIDKKDWTSIKKYSTDIAAAWEVVEELIKDGIFLMSGDKSTVHVYFGRNGPNCNKTGADTAFLAICLAALKAKGVDVEES